jgi:tetratricopeptide (TPR) repeat protein
MVNKDKLVLVLAYGQAEVRGFITSLSDDQRTAVGSFEHWSAKDVIGHLTEWVARLVNDLNLASQLPDAPHQVPASYDHIDETNAEIYRQYQALSWEDVNSKLGQSFSQLNNHVQAATLDELADTRRIPWREGRPLWRMLVGTAVEHPILHLSYYHIAEGNLAEAIRLQETCVARLLELDDSPAWRGLHIYNLACVQALSGQVEKALANLGEALQLAPDLNEWSKQDPDLVGLKDHPAYQALYG